MKPGQLGRGERFSLFREGKEEGEFRKEDLGCMHGFMSGDGSTRHMLSDKSVPGSYQVIIRLWKFLIRLLWEYKSFHLSLKCATYHQRIHFFPRTSSLPWGRAAMTKNLFSVPIFFIVFRETLEAAIIVSVLLGLAEQIVSRDPNFIERPAEPRASGEEEAANSEPVVDEAVQRRRLLRKMRTQVNEMFF
jgi:hypothetical protein